MGHAYVVSGNLTSNAAATKDFLSIKSASNQILKLRGITLGNDAATAAQGVRWQLVVISSAATDVTGTAFTALPQD